MEKSFPSLNYFKQREMRVKERFFHNQRIFFESLILGIASPEQIRRWAQRKLPNGSVVGEVLSAKTLDYKNLKPLRDGLFCERIFGPIKDFHCACNKSQPNDKVRFCPDCEVEYYPATIRRHRLGYIELASGSVHIWYFKGRPNYLSILLDRKRKSLETLIYCTRVRLNTASLGLVPKRILSREVPPNQLYRPGQTIPIGTNVCCKLVQQPIICDLFVSAPEPDDRPIPHYCSGINASARPDAVRVRDINDETMAGMRFDDLLREYEEERKAKLDQALNCLGGQGIVNMIHHLNLPLLRELLANQIVVQLNTNIRSLAQFDLDFWPSLERKHRRLVAKRTAKIQRLKLVLAFLRTKRDPAWMVLFALPVLPPTIRPISVLERGGLISSDLNRLYQRLLFRNNRMKKTLVLDTETIGFHQRLVQEAVDAILENGKGGSTLALGPGNRPLKSLADRLKGKRGRFRLHLLGKRVDYSGRSVIVVGPKMRLHECGLPREMALKLFSPFLIRRILEKYSIDFVRAKIWVQNEEVLIWPVLLEIMGQYPILLNRAPTLHRLGIQAFQPRLVASQAILLHPLVCTAFNADFDGDQMAVHVPLSFHARAEAWKLLWSRNNLLAPATGDPILAPSQDMVLGFYYLTTSGHPDLKKREELELPIDVIDEAFMAQKEERSHVYFYGYEDAMIAFYQKTIRAQTPIWLRLAPYQLSQSGAPPMEPVEIQIHADGLGFVMVDDVQQRRRWFFSTNEGEFLRTYTIVLSQFVQTTAGRILVNQLLANRDLPIPHRFYQQIDELLTEMIDKKRAEENKMKYKKRKEINSAIDATLEKLNNKKKNKKGDNKKRLAF